MQIREAYQIDEAFWYKIGGKVKYFIQCSSWEDVMEALHFVQEKKPNRIFICGQGSNLIFTDDYFDGAVIQIVASKSTTAITVSTNKITAFAGTILDDVITYALSHNLQGLEWAGGLPGTVGAGVRGNVGAYGGEIKDTLVNAEVLDYSEDTPALRTLTKQELQFIYRGSFIKSHKKMVVIAATFELKKSSDEEVAKALQEYELHKKQRKENHPLEYPNCGSVFKNLRDVDQIAKILEIYPDLKERVENKWYGKVAVASLIERLGLKGYRVGDAQVSEKHALFIVNLGNATAKDVLRVIADIQNKFQETFGFTLEVEVEVVE